MPGRVATRGKRAMCVPIWMRCAVQAPGRGTGLNVLSQIPHRLIWRNGGLALQG